MPGFDVRMLDGMRVVAAIVDARSFARAGEVLDMTQSGVSRAVARLEQALGIRLLDRSTRSVRLTDEGRRFYEQALPLLTGLEELARDTAQGAATVRGRLRVNVNPFFAHQVLGPRLGDFLEAHPELQVELVVRDLLGDMVTEGFDVAIRFGEPTESGLVSRKLLETRIITAASPTYLARFGYPAAPKDLSGGRHRCIQYRDPRSGRTFPWEFHGPRRKLVLDLSGQLTVNDAATLQSVCCAGYGIAQLMALGTEPLFADGRLVDLFPAWSKERFPLHALYPTRAHLPPKTRAFIDFVVACAGSSP
ncbi:MULTISPECIES: LysR family transcriptional regulator [Delftia]|nr:MULTISPECIES: LysR family transcriptional regulator [Delftia]PZP71301.1 MAG: LysR family transcriptional regulator [Delftia acidovorans]